MKKGFILRVTAILLIICMTAGLSLTAAAAYPTPTNNVYDGTGTLSDSVIETIKSTNDTLYDKVNAKISICIVESLGGEEISTYSRNVFNEWKLGEGVLLVVSTGDENYYAVQSVGIDDVLTNDQLSTILQEFLEPDFSEGNVARGIQKTINKLSSFMKTELPAADAEKEDTDKAAEEDGEKKVTLGSIILSILKIILWTVIIIIAAFVILFVVALFNDDAAELMQRYVFSHFTGNRPANNRQDYYDERLYGRPQQNNSRQLQGQNPQRRLPPPNQQQRQQYDRYRQGGVRYDDEYYGQSGQYNQNRPNKYNQYAQNGQYTQNGQYSQNGQYRQQQSRNPGQQNQYNSNYEYTQQYTINTGNSSQNNRSQRNNNNRY